MSTDLMLIPEKINPLVIFTPRGSQDILDAIRHKARSTPRDMSTKEGRAAIASLARTIASSKVFLDDSGKTLTEEWTQKTKSVNIERKRIREGLDDLRDEVRKPLTDWEDKEKNRIAVHETLLANLYRNSEFDCANPSIELIQSRQMIVGSVYASHQWEEFSERASQALDIVREKLQNALELAEKQEKERVELERLRHEESARLQQENERKQRERDERLQSEAADRARLAAELEAQRKADIASHERWREQERLQRERDEQEQRAKKAENDKKQSELRAKAAADKANAIKRKLFARNASESPPNGGKRKRLPKRERWIRSIGLKSSGRLPLH